MKAIFNNDGIKYTSTLPDQRFKEIMYSALHNARLSKDIEIMFNQQIPKKTIIERCQTIAVKAIMRSKRYNDVIVEHRARMILLTNNIATEYAYEVLDKLQEKIKVKTK